jgi:enediyne polyketide synthase
LDAPAAVISSIKANIGHTKAAAGVAGLLKAVMAVHHQILPPATGFKRLHPVLEGENAGLRLLSKGEAWPAERPLRAGVSSFGFGGINVHLALEGVNNTRRTKLIPREQKLLASPQDCELFLLGADDLPSLSALLRQLAEIAPRLSLGELTDLAATLARQDNRYQVRAAIIAATPAQLAERIEHLYAKINAGENQLFEIKKGIFLSAAKAQGRITLLFPGQASPVRLDGDIYARRFTQVEALYERAGLPARDDLNSTDVAQPAIITAELAGLQILASLGVRGQLAIGHSVGEFAALHWAGAMDEATLLDIVRVRGRAMAEVTGLAGAMLSLAVAGDKAETLCAKQEGINIACFNGPNQTVISGEFDAVERLRQRTQAQGIKSSPLPVSHGFHSHLMKPAAKVLEAHLAPATLQPIQRRVISTITGTELATDADLKLLLKEQMTHPVRFSQALKAAVPETDLFIETGPGQVLTALVHQMTDVPIVTLDAAGPSLQGLLTAIGAAYVMGANVKRDALFAGRFTRPFSLEWQPKFFVNPCELAPQSNETLSPVDEIHPVETSEVFKTSEVLETKEVETSEVLKTSEVLEDVVETKEIDVGRCLRCIVAKRVDLPMSAIQNNQHLLSDLHLNSITVGQIVTEIGRQFGLKAPPDPTAYAEATIEQIAQAIEERIAMGETESTPALPAGIDAWVRPFTVEQVERPLRGKPLAPKGHGGWHIFGPPPAGLEQALNAWGGGGVVLCLPVEVNVMLEAAKTVLNNTSEHCYFVLVQHGMSAAAFARTLHREQPDITTCVITLPLDDNAVERILAEVQIAEDYHEICYDIVRRELVLKPLTEYKAEQHVLTADDILLVTGGGKGITAECAAALARDSGVRLILLGRASPEKDAELSENLARFQSMGINFKYFQTDVTDAEAVKATVAEVGTVTAILHGAGANQPTTLRDLDETAFQRTLAPKVGGLRHLLAAIDPKQLRLLISFGSIIATTGMPGEADYAVANEWLASMTADFHKEHPNCRCLTLEWTVWSDVGMGKRLGSDEILAQQGITPIPPDVGVAVLRQAVMASDWPTTVVVTGRMPDVPTLRLERPDMPFLRFLEQPRVYYPNIELVVESEISLTSDPYLNDHVYEGQRLFPAVMGLEAMAQVASTVLGVEEVPVFEEVEFSRPVVVDETKSETLQIATLVQGEGIVEVALRCAQTGFKVDHFRARCRFGNPPTDSIQMHDIKEEYINIVPELDLYGNLLFQEGRFKRLHAYRHIEATQCVGEIVGDDSMPWFGRYLSPTLMLGDAGSRDATIHAIQVCTPHAQLLPVGIDRLNFVNVHTQGPWTLFAKERWRKGDLFCYDLTVWSQDGQLREKWEGLHLRKVSAIRWQEGWLEPLLAPYIERRVQELIQNVSLRVIIHREATERESRSDNAIKMLLGMETVRRPDGKPEVPNSDMNVSAAHVGDLSLAVAGPMTVACDLEPVVVREDQVWHDLLGNYRDFVDVISQETKEDSNRAATRVWTVRECLKKAGALSDTPLTLKSIEKDGWILLGAGNMTIATSVVSVKTSNAPLAIAILVGN